MLTGGYSPAVSRFGAAASRPYRRAAWSAVQLPTPRYRAAKWTCCRARLAARRFVGGELRMPPKAATPPKVSSLSTAVASECGGHDHQQRHGFQWRHGMVSSGGVASGTTIAGGTVEIAGGGSVRWQGDIRGQQWNAAAGLIHQFQRNRGGNDGTGHDSTCATSNSQRHVTSSSTTTSATLSVTDGFRYRAYHPARQLHGFHLHLSNDAFGGTSIVDPPILYFGRLPGADPQGIKH